LSATTTTATAVVGGLFVKYVKLLTTHVHCPANVWVVGRALKSIRQLQVSSRDRGLMYTTRNNCSVVRAAAIYMSGGSRRAGKNKQPQLLAEVCTLKITHTWGEGMVLTEAWMGLRERVLRALGSNCLSKLSAATGWAEKT
jgi:hypothetical protein